MCMVLLMRRGGLVSISVRVDPIGGGAWTLWVYVVVRKGVLGYAATPQARVVRWVRVCCGGHAVMANCLVVGPVVTNLTFELGPSICISPDRRRPVSGEA